MLTAIIAIFVLGFLAPYLLRLFKEYTGWLLALLPLGIFTWFLSWMPTVADGQVVSQSRPWVEFGGLFELNLSFYLDGLSLLFALMITGIGTLIVIYAGGYLKGHEYLGRFYTSLLLFMGSMLGVVVADNLITLFVFWELTSFTSFLLIGFGHEKEPSRRAALQALIVTGLGGLALLAGFILMAFTAGTFEMSEILTRGDMLRDSGMYLPMLLLVLAGAFTKSAQFPFHFWLPNAMQAPTPVSAYLHSATMVKAGVYLLARLNPALGSTPEWFYLLGGFGAITMVVSAWLALRYVDLKQVLAYTTVMALGALTMLIGMGHELAIKGAATFTLVHSLYKGSLFMVAGSVDHETGTREVDKLGGLRTVMPISAGAAVIAALSMAGIPPFLGFIGKEVVYEAALETASLATAFTVLAVLANVAVVAAAGIVAIRPFFGQNVETPKKAHEAPLSMWLGGVVLAALGLIFGVLPFLIDSSLINPAMAAMLGEPVDIYLSLWHGINVPLMLSAVTLLIGIGLYRYWDTIRQSLPMAGFGRAFADVPDNSYDHAINGLLGVAGWQTRILQNGMLRYYILVIMATFVVATGATIYFQNALNWAPEFASVHFYEWILFAIVLASCLVAAMVRSRLAIIIAIGVIGYSLALVYIMYGAADLAKTQILVETMTVILVALVLIHLPPLTSVEKTASKARDAIIAITSGGVLTLMTLAAIHLPFDTFISEYYAEASYPLAHGRNIVNVILVDFRALDTMGEVVVIAVAGIAVYALVKMKSPLSSAKKKEEQA